MSGHFFTGGARPGVRSLAAGLAIGAACLPGGASASTLTTIYSFLPGIADGVNASGPLLAAPDGSLYGATQYGGTVSATGACMRGCGTIFKLTPIPKKTTYAKTVIHKFTATHGFGPIGQIVMAADGSLYGALSESAYNAPTGLAAGTGTIFHLVPPTSPTGSWTESVIYALPSTSSTTYVPLSTPEGVVADSQGRLYVVAVNGGPPDQSGNPGGGGIFALTPPATAGGAWGYQLLHVFHGPAEYVPNADLTVDSAGWVYGSSAYNGANGAGAGYVFRVALTPKVSYNVLTTVHSTQGFGNPTGSVTPGPGGVLYGTAAGNFIPSVSGVAYSLTPPVAPATNWALKVLHSFGAGQGAGVSLCVDPSSVLFGGGSSFYTLAPPTGTAQTWKLADLQQLGSGASPYQRMVRDSSGAFYWPSGQQIFKFQP